MSWKLVEATLRSVTRVEGFWIVGMGRVARMKGRHA